MDELVQAIRTKFGDQLPSYEELGNFVRHINNDIPDYHDFLPDNNQSGKYSRNILCMEPLECVLLRWPPGVESAVHFHDGFWGYVWVLQGTCENIVYQLNAGKMSIINQMYARAGGVIDEPDGTIHLIRNPSKSEELVTCHFYYPALETLDGLKVYDLDEGKIGTLNERAATASFLEPEAHFSNIEEGAFKYLSPLEAMPNQSHRMSPVLPKPKSSEIKDMIGSYYAEQAKDYDLFDLLHHSRKQYIQKINALIAHWIQSLTSIDCALAIACGTGRRAAKIRDLSGKDYNITCVDISEEMCCQALERNVQSIAGDWLDVEVDTGPFDVTTFLYAFGHLPYESERVEALRKINQNMKKGGLLFIDVFNLNDKNEWGPKALQKFNQWHLDHFGYQKGDLFYKKAGGEALAFLHYFTEAEMADLLDQAEFDVVKIYYIGYVQKSGEILTHVKDEGSMFFVARKR